jgi:ribonuclease BN (tRNA processing enzyme)
MRREEMEVIFLGTNGWYDSDTGNTICTLINSKKYHIILDAGNGIYKADRYIKDDKPVYLFLSHSHLDHIEGLHILNKFRFSQGLHIYGQKGTAKTLDTIINKPFTVPLNELPFPVVVHELSEGPYKVPFPLECRFLLHASPCMGYRIDLDGKIIAYCPDTGVCENAVKLAQDADLLITECSHKPGESNPQWPHLTPQDAADIARQAGAKRLALTHFDAGRYVTVPERMDAAKSVQNFEGIIVTQDGMILEP